MRKNPISEYRVERARILPCRGCPTKGCSCLTELEEALLKSSNQLIDATGKTHITSALRWIQKKRKGEKP